MKNKKLQELSSFINPTFFKKKEYVNIHLYTLYDFKKIRTENIRQETKKCILRYFEDLLNEEDIKEKLNYLILSKLSKAYNLDFQNIQHFKKGRVNISAKNILWFNFFLMEVWELINMNKEDKEQPDFLYNDKVNFKYYSDEFNKTSFLNAPPILNSAGDWVAPVRCDDEIVYIECDKMKLIRRIK